MTSSQFPILLLLGCLLSGLFGAALGGWLCARAVRSSLRSALRLAMHEPANGSDARAEVLNAVRQAIQIELDFHGRQLAERDAARADEQRRCWIDDNERRTQEFRALLQRLPAGSASVAAPGTSAWASAGHRSLSRADESARPPELMHAPLPRPQISEAATASETELTDEELDALPPEVPVRRRKRDLLRPGKPVFRDL